MDSCFIGSPLFGMPAGYKVHDYVAYLFQKFGGTNPHERCVPHITLKSSFKADDETIGRINDHLEQFFLQREAPVVELFGLGHFGSSTVYWDVLDDVGRFDLLQKELAASLKTVFPEIIFAPSEPTIMPHVTLLEDIENERFRDIYKKEQLKFVTAVPVERFPVFDASLFKRKEGSRQWEAVRFFHFKPSFVPPDSFTISPR